MVFKPGRYLKTLPQRPFRKPFPDFLIRSRWEVAQVRMDERKSRVLQAIIDDYVSTAEPVGSRTIARKYRLGVSPATIRNEMADLEDLGFLEQPHTSAGRIPSNRGYRYYVDCLMQHRDLSPEEEDQIRKVFERKVREFETLIQLTARSLSDATHLTSLVTGLQVSKAAFKQLKLVPLSGDRALLVFVTDTGFVENKVIEVPLEVTLVELERISELLTDNLKGTPVESLRRDTLRQLQDELGRYGALLEQSLDFLAGDSDTKDRERVYLAGTTNMLAQPEFKDIDKVRSLLGALEQDEVVFEVLGDPNRTVGLCVTIGEEIKYREMQECSMVSATYSVGDRTIGRIGVLGPKRMEYAKVVAVVENVTQRLTNALNKGFKIDK